MKGVGNYAATYLLVPCCNPHRSQTIGKIWRQQYWEPGGIAVRFYPIDYIYAWIPVVRMADGMTMIA